MNSPKQIKIKESISESPSKGKYPTVLYSDLSAAKALSYWKLREKYENNLLSYVNELKKKKHQMEALV
jgi:hypothetical protein